ncbi:MAG: IS3 family transposase [Bacteroidetes bacterium]|nr:IS3 family transposase [Bacteroidota bacterium]
MAQGTGRHAHGARYIKKGGRHLFQERWKTFQFMKEYSNRFPIEKMSKVLRVSRSGYYRWLKSDPSQRTVENRELTDEIRRIHAKSKQTYGSPRITAELNVRSRKVSRPRVARLMKKAGIRSKVIKKYRVATTDSKHAFLIAPNLLDRDFKVGEICKTWVSDITYIPTEQGWLYLTTVIDLGDRKVIGWALSTTMRAEQTTVAAWKMAVINRPITSELIFHSDRGVQYACTEFTDLLKAYTTVKRSIACPDHKSGSRKGNCWDNAVAESFFKSLKSEWTKWYRYQTFKQAQLSVFEYIETWYNINRRHSALNYMTPIEYQTFLQNRNMAA